MCGLRGDYYVAVPSSLLCSYPAVGGFCLADVADVFEPPYFVACWRCVVINVEERPDLVELGPIH